MRRLPDDPTTIRSLKAYTNLLANLKQIATRLIVFFRTSHVLHQADRTGLVMQFCRCFNMERFGGTWQPSTAQG